uniref:Uncharacterized protein n=1 Tax=Melanopsichium pennsylvanicum 4 TaxID=1398559 RepID=A0A077QZE8_9BASI|nr:uncharacterized protein BN887_06046 [Melanopsichium pennsylvanicum 4]
MRIRSVGKEALKMFCDLGHDEQATMLHWLTQNSGTIGN